MNTRKMLPLALLVLLGACANSEQKQAELEKNRLDSLTNSMSEQQRLDSIAAAESRAIDEYEAQQKDTVVEAKADTSK